VGEVQLSPAAPDRLTERAPDSSLVRLTEPAPDRARFDVFGGRGVVVVADPLRLEPARRAVDRVLAEVDLACSRFREDSELSAVNASPGRAVHVSRLMMEAIEAALRAAEETDGDVDPTIGRALIALGYDRDFEELTANGVTAMPRLGAVPGWHTVDIDPIAQTVRLPRGVTLDLGATAKALAADRAAEAAADAARCGVLVSLSGDLAIAGAPPADGWRVRVTDDHRAGVDAPGQWITLRSGGLATSSTIVRRWETREGVAHHLVDPSTGRPVDSPWRTVSVAAATCFDANIASTASIIRGTTAIDWLRELGLPSRLVAGNGTVRHVAGWPAGGDDLAVSNPFPTPVRAAI
jgi:FAD:protein FMN transferase